MDHAQLHPDSRTGSQSDICRSVCTWPQEDRSSPWTATGTNRPSVAACHGMRGTCSCKTITRPTSRHKPGSATWRRSTPTPTSAVPWPRALWDEAAASWPGCCVAGAAGIACRHSIPPAACVTFAQAAIDNGCGVPRAAWPFPARALESLLAEEILEVVGPAGVEAAQRATERLAMRHQEQRQLLIDRVQAAVEAEQRAAREYKQTDATYVAVRQALGAEWEAALARVAAEQSRLTEFDRATTHTADVGSTRTTRAVGRRRATAVEPSQRQRQLETAVGPSADRGDRGGH